jgi:hypothetical protein
MKPRQALAHPQKQEDGLVMLRWMSAALRVGLIVVAVGGCGLSMEYPAPSGPMTTLMPGWERYFAVQWTAEPEGDGSRRVDGYVTSLYGEYAADMRILVQARDASDAIVMQRIVSIPAGVGGFGRAYFDVRHMPVADHYQVFVWDYRLMQFAERLQSP